MTAALELCYSAPDPTCDTSEVARLLWSVIGLAAGAALMTILRPGWVALVALVVADLWWLWIDMEGPVLVERGSHGVHLADVPVLVTLPALAIGAGRLWLRRSVG